MLSKKAQAVADHVSDLEHMQLLKISGVSFREFLLEHRRFPVIAITGQSGVGKTTFTDIFINSLHERLESDFPLVPPDVKKLTELPQMSPYLPIIKASSDGLSDQTLWEKNQELFRVLDEAILTKASLESKNSVIVMDFSIIQVLVYAHMKIKGAAGKDFIQTFNGSFKNLPKPDFLVHIAAEPETVLKRLQSRGSFIDDQIQKHTEELHSYYSEDGRDLLSEYYEGIPIIRVHTDLLDLVNNTGDKALATKEAVNETLMRIAA
ncbi:MAG: deoxynucleoside kinase [Candidatus Gracilibacteria bacterium]|nr:deoxynucleoside kinase [Candidatus Gracilibacteria bacterium]